MRLCWLIKPEPEHSAPKRRLCGSDRVSQVEREGLAPCGAGIPRPLTDVRNRQSMHSDFALIARKLIAKFTAQLQQLGYNRIRYSNKNSDKNSGY